MSQQSTISQTARIVIVEDYDMIAETLSRFLAEQPHLEVVFRAKNKKEVLDFLEHEPEVDLVLMDMFLGLEEDHQEPEGLQAARTILGQLYQSARKMKVMMLTKSMEGRWIKKAFDMGVKGYVPKEKDTIELLKAIDLVLSGKLYYENKVQDIMYRYQADMDFPPELVYLTPSEKEILKMIAQGFTTEDIAKFRNCKMGTIESHRTNIIRKFDASNAPNMIAKASKMGFI